MVSAVCCAVVAITPARSVAFFVATFALPLFFLLGRLSAHLLGRIVHLPTCFGRQPRSLRAELLGCFVGLRRICSAASFASRSTLPVVSSCLQHPLGAFVSLREDGARLGAKPVRFCLSCSISTRFASMSSANRSWSRARAAVSASRAPPLTHRVVVGG